MIAAEQDWLKSPATVNGVSDTVKAGNNKCDKTPGSGVGPYVTQKGSGFDNGDYVHKGTQVSSFTAWPSNVAGEGVFWADSKSSLCLFSDPANTSQSTATALTITFSKLALVDAEAHTDCSSSGTNSNYGLGVALSTGGGKFGSYLHYDFAPYCLRKGIVFADITGDGRKCKLSCSQNDKGSQTQAMTSAA